MDPRRLLTFRVVAHERSFSRAAEKLSLSQPSVSHQVALLEYVDQREVFESRLARQTERQFGPGVILGGGGASRCATRGAISRRRLPI